MNKDYEDKPCIFCGEMCRHTRDGSNARDYYTCKNHGQYCITDDFTHLGTEREKSVVSGYLFETKDRAEPIILLDNEISKIRNNSLVPKTSMQKLNKIMLYAYSLNQGFSTSFDVLPPYVGYAQNKLEMVDMLLALIELGYIFYKDNLYRISIKGLEYAEKLLTTNENSTKVFVAMGFKEDLLKACEEVIKPVCAELGYQAYNISEKEHNNDILDEIIAGIRTSKFVVVDFTYNNAGAYFEAGFAQGLGLPVIRCCKKEWFDGKDEQGNKNHLHFDIEHYNMIMWQDENDLRKKLKTRILATI